MNDIKKNQSRFSLLNIIGILTTSCVLMSCTDDAIINEYKNLETGFWSYDSPVTFEFTIDDAAQSYDITYMVRNSMDYEFYNLYITYSLTNTNGDTVKSSMHESNLIDAKTGKPLGGTAGDYYDHSVGLLQNMQFPDTGTYRFTIKQFMRRDTLNHIYAMGLKVLPNTVN